MKLHPLSKDVQFIVAGGRLMKSHPSPRLYRQLLADGGGREIFCSGIATGELPILLCITPSQPCS